MKILLIAGHGAGDSGAVGNGYKEADLTRQAATILEGKLKGYNCTVERYPSSRNAYMDNRGGKLAVSFSSYDLIIEIHFNSFNKTAKGTEVLYRSNMMHTLALDICSAISKAGFNNRGAKVRTDLANMNTCYVKGIPYLLVETCFIDNASDIKLYKSRIDTIWGNVCNALIKHYNLKSKSTSTTGWKKLDGEWRYFEKGSMVKNVWRKDSTGKWCYLGSDGKMVKNNWAKDSTGKWCYLGSDGYQVKNKWVSWKGSSYFLKKDGYMAIGDVDITEHFDKDGKWTSGKQK